MAYDEGLAELMSDALSDFSGITEKKMFGGICFMWNGNMLCGVHKNGGMVRVGKDNHPDALKLEGVEPMAFTGRPMGGMVDISQEVIVDEARLQEVLALARDFVGSLPPK